MKGLIIIGLSFWCLSGFCISFGSEITLNHFNTVDFNDYFDDILEEAYELTKLPLTASFQLNEIVRLKLHVEIEYLNFIFRNDLISSCYTKSLFYERKYLAEYLSYRYSTNYHALIINKIFLLYKLQFRNKHNYVKFGGIYNLKYYFDKKKYYPDSKKWTLEYLDNIYLEISIGTFRFMSLERQYFFESAINNRLVAAIVLYRGVNDSGPMGVSFDSAPNSINDFKNGVHLYFRYTFSDYEFNTKLHLTEIVKMDSTHFPISVGFRILL